MRRPNIEEHPKGAGKYRVRTRSDGKLVTVVSGVSLAQAEAAADAFVRSAEADDIRDGVTLKAFGLGFLDRREGKGVRGIATDRVYWNKHIAAAEFGDTPVNMIRRRDCLDWLDGLQGLAYRSKKKVLSLLRVALDEALDRELIESNPARSVKVHRSGDRTAVDDLAGILSPAEQQALLKAVPKRYQPLVVFALTTGLRRSEQWWLKWEDIGDGLMVVRRSVKGLPPKSGHGRTVHLLEPAVRALELAPGRRDFIWTGNQGRRTKTPRHWSKWVAAAGITRRVRWHDLRHTCATALLAGWWGRKWSIDEVCQHLGHSSVTVTERYARKLAETNQLAVAGTSFPKSSPLLLLSAGADSGIRTRDLRFTKAGRSVAVTPSYVQPGSPLGTSSNVKAWSLAYAAGRALGQPRTHLVTVVRRRVKEVG
jgi:integrase